MITKGKWTVRNSGGTVELITVGHPKVICTLEKVPLKITPEVEANARLIAAAPALLEACKEITEGIRYIKGILPDEMKKPYQKLLAAIKLAEKGE